MFKLTIEGATTEALVAAMQDLIRTMTPQQPAAIPQQITPEPVIPQQPAPAAVPIATTPPAPSIPTAPVTPPTANNPPTAVPTAAPTYDLDTIARAGAYLVQVGKGEQATGLLAKYNIQTLTQLHPDQYGAFAMDLRAIGAQI